MMARPLLGPIGLALGVAALALPAAAEDAKPIRIGVSTAIQLQIGRDAVNGVKMAVAEVNAKGGVLGRQLEVVVADEGESPKDGVAAVNKLTGDSKVDVLIGGYDSGVTLAELPHIARAKTIYIGLGSASPAITAKVKEDYDHYKYIFRVNPLSSDKQANELLDFAVKNLAEGHGYKKISVLGENAKWVQDMVPALKDGMTKAGIQVPMAEFFDPATADFSPIFAKVKENGSQYLMVILSHAASDVFVKQWYDARVPVPIGGIDVKSQDANFFQRVGGKAIGEVTTNYILRAPLTPKTVGFWDGFVTAYGAPPVYSGSGGYDSVYIYAQAVERAKSTAADAVIKEMEKTDFVGVPGRIVFDARHDVEDGPGKVNQLFVQWQQDGKRVVVWPKELAGGPMINPPWLQQN